MQLSQWIRPPRRLLILFLAITFALATMLGWLGWRLVEQDRALQNQRIQERLDHVADLVTTSLSRKFAETEEELSTFMSVPDVEVAVAASHLAKEVGDDGLIVGLTPDALSSYPGGRLPYYPDLAAPAEPPADVFASGEVLEFQQRNYAAAAAVFRERAESKDPVIRAGALLRLARNLRKLRRPAAALAVYDDLMRLGSTSVGGLPAELLSRHARCEVLDELKRLDELHREASSLYLDLQKGRWSLTRAAYRYYAQESRRWMAGGPESGATLQLREESVLALAAGVESVWDEWKRIRRAEGSPSGRRSLWVENRSILVLWRGTPDRLVALIAGPECVRRRWLGDVESLVERQGARLALSDADGRRVIGQSTAAAQQGVRTAAETGLPWTVRLVSADPAGKINELATRQRLLLVALAITGFIILAGSYFSARAVTRELEVARLQSEFVSAVSHEFRTPLASMLQLSELLADGRVPSEARRQDYYLRLQRESERLHRVVETLLDFGSMEAGARTYRFESVDPATAVRAVAEEFAQKVEDRGYHVEIHLSESLPCVRVDREALSLGLWNLLDNAVKYSPTCKTIWVEVDQEDSHVAIRIRDKGLGIAPSDQKQIFKKFVRGASAQAAGVKGSGLGLALVRHIAAAHSGDIRVESQPGAGSIFTMRLPATKG